jgi:NDP-sugar pyrophosphorylase family protein
MKILIPIAGSTPYFPPEDFPFPKPLIEISGKMMITRVVENLRNLAANPHFIFVALKEEAAKYSYESIFRLITEDHCDLVQLRHRTAGALCSSLMAIDHIDEDAPLVIANGDQVFDFDLSTIMHKFVAAEADAGVITFESTHPRWSYVRVEGTNLVVEASEKRVISKRAIAGIYYFRRGAFFIEAAQSCIMANDSLDGTFFIAPSLNQMVLAGKKILAIDVDRECYHSFYLPNQIDAFEKELAIKHASEASHKSATRINVVVPAAGEGSRFVKEAWTAPKPFIDVLGKPMVEHVLDNLLFNGTQPIALMRRSHLNDLPAARDSLRKRNVIVETVESLTEGTACTILLARSHIDNLDPLLVANSDQLVDFSCEDFIADALRRNLDGSILVFRDSARDPKWSFARLDESGLVVEVAEKRPISELATVGIYFFARGRDFVQGALDMIVRNDRVNNEFYTCPVYNYLIRNGAKIGVFEVPSNAMHGLGTPADLRAYLERKGGWPSVHSPHDHPSGKMITN